MKYLLTIPFLVLLLLFSCHKKSTKDEALSQYFCIMDSFVPLAKNVKEVNSKVIPLAKSTFTSEIGTATPEEIELIKNQIELVLSNISIAIIRIKEVEEIQSNINLKEGIIIYLEDVYKLYDDFLKFVIGVMENGIENYDQKELDEGLDKLKKSLINLSQKQKKIQTQFFKEFGFNQTDFNIINERYSIY